MLYREEIERMERIIHGRPVGIITYGHSLEHLVQNIERFRHFDICWCAINSEQGADEILGPIEKGVEIVTAYAIELHNKRFRAYAPKRCLPFGNSIQSFLCQLLICEMTKCVIFGFDGYEDKGRSVHHRLAYNNHRGVGKNHKKETEVFNDTFAAPDGVEILNCSPGTHVKSLKEVGYDGCIDTLAFWLNKDTPKKL